MVNSVNIQRVLKHKMKSYSKTISSIHTLAWYNL